MARQAGLVNRGIEHGKQEVNEPNRNVVEEECEEDLFEINLESAKSSPQRLPARTDSVLLANCLLPAADISGAVPAKSRAWNELIWFKGFLYVDNIGIESKRA